MDSSSPILNSDHVLFRIPHDIPARLQCSITSYQVFVNIWGQCDGLALLSWRHQKCVHVVSHHSKSFLVRWQLELNLVVE
jgi:hypothetical protein